MDRKRRLFRKGFTAMEIVLALIFIMFLLGAFEEYQRSMEVRRKVDETLWREKAIQHVVERLYFANLEYAKNNCYGWQDANCQVLSLTPRVIDSTTLEIRTWDSTVLNTLAQVGCRVQQVQPAVYRVECWDGWGRPFQFSDQYEHTPATSYTAPYNGNVYVLTVTPSKGNAVAIDLSKEIDYSLTKSEDILNTIGSAIVRFVQIKRNEELANVCDSSSGGTYDPAGGLGSWDDTIVPWVWEIVSRTPNALCSGVENTNSNCGCSSFDNSAYWETNNAYCVINTIDEMRRVLANLSLPMNDATDGFGNRIEIVPLADANGNPVNCPPPRPRETYPQVFLGKTVIGVKDNVGNWVYRVAVVSD